MRGCGLSTSSAMRPVGRNSMSPGCFPCKRPSRVEERPSWAARGSASPRSHRGARRSPGQHIMIADSPNEFAKAVLHACSDEVVSDEAGCFGCKLPSCAEEMFCWPPPSWPRSQPKNGRRSWAAHRSASPRFHRGL